MNRIDLAVTQARYIKWRQLLQAMPQRVLLFQPCMKCLRLVKCKNAPGAGLRVTRVAKKSLFSSGLVMENQLIGPAGEMIRQFSYVFCGLLSDSTERGTSLFCLNDASGFPTHEQKVIAWAVRQLKFTDSDTLSSIAIEIGIILENPACSPQKRIYFLPCCLLGRDLHDLLWV